MLAVHVQVRLCVMHEEPKHSSAWQQHDTPMTHSWGRMGQVYTCDTSIPPTLAAVKVPWPEQSELLLSPKTEKPGTAREPGDPSRLPNSV